MHRIVLLSLLGLIGILFGAASPAVRDLSPPEFIVVVPDWVPRWIDMGTKSGVPDLHDGTKWYIASYRSGWNDRLAGRHAEYKPYPVSLESPGVFSNDLDMPFRQESGFSTDARHDGYAACDHALRASSKR